MRINAGGSRQKTIARPAQAILLETKHQRRARLLLAPVDLSMGDTLALLVPQVIPALLRECSAIALPLCQRWESQLHGHSPPRSGDLVPAPGYPGEVVQPARLAEWRSVAVAGRGGGARRVVPGASQRAPVGQRPAAVAPLGSAGSAVRGPGVDSGDGRVPGPWGPASARQAVPRRRSRKRAIPPFFASCSWADRAPTDSSD
jgi:hypothetical protein